MILARVTGNVVATHKNSHLIGKKLLLVQQIDMYGNVNGEEAIAVDGVGAGIGDFVLAIAEGGSARQVIRANNPLTPVDLCIAGIVDSLASSSA